MTKKQVKADGRRERSERSRQAIIDAKMELIAEGILVPTAQQVSDRANVGIRTVFRHFVDMESLFVIQDEQARVNYEPMFLGGNRTGSLAERIPRAVKRRSQGFERTWNATLSAKAQSWRYNECRRLYARNQKQLRKDLEYWLPEVKQLSSTKLEAVNAVASFEMWHRLRELQSQSKKASIEIIVELLSGLLA